MTKLLFFCFGCSRTYADPGKLFECAALHLDWQRRLGGPGYRKWL